MLSMSEACDSLRSEALGIGDATAEFFPATLPLDVLPPSGITLMMLGSL
jgi:hypothetical protein